MGNVTLMDGAGGTLLWSKAKDRRPVWQYNVENPDIVVEVHREYVEAGAGLILANTFGANAMSVSGTPYQVRDIVSRGISLAREAAGDRARVALDIGPLTALLEPYGPLTEQEAERIFEEQISSGVDVEPENRPDLIYLETFMDIELLKIAVRVASRHRLPIFCSMTFDAGGHTMMGNSVRDMVMALRPFPVSAVGLNCSLGPDAAVPLMKKFQEHTDLPLLFKPNAGKPVTVGGRTKMQFDVDTFVADSLPALDYGVSYIGGCCGTDPEYIRRLGQALAQREQE